MKSPSERINEILDYLMNERGMKQYEIEDISHISRGTLTKWRAKDVNNVTSNNLGKLMLAFPQLSCEWVLRGRGEMLIPPALAGESTLETAIEKKPYVVEDGGASVADYEIKIRSLTDENAELRRKLDLARKMVEATLR